MTYQPQQAAYQAFCFATSRPLGEYPHSPADRGCRCHLQLARRRLPAVLVFQTCPWWRLARHRWAAGPLRAPPRRVRIAQVLRCHQALRVQQDRALHGSTRALPQRWYLVLPWFAGQGWQWFQWFGALIHRWRAWASVSGMTFPCWSCYAPKSNPHLSRRQCCKFIYSSHLIAAFHYPQVRPACAARHCAWLRRRGGPQPSRCCIYWHQGRPRRHAI